MGPFIQRGPFLQQLYHRDYKISTPRLGIAVSRGGTRCWVLAETLHTMGLTARMIAAILITTITRRATALFSVDAQVRRTSTMVDSQILPVVNILPNILITRTLAI
jgi:hypothetical protein